MMDHLEKAASHWEHLKSYEPLYIDDESRFFWVTKADFPLVGFQYMAGMDGDCAREL